MRFIILKIENKKVCTCIANSFVSAARVLAYNRPFANLAACAFPVSHMHDGDAGDGERRGGFLIIAVSDRSLQSWACVDGVHPKVVELVSGGDCNF